MKKRISSLNSLRKEETALTKHKKLFAVIITALLFVSVLPAASAETLKGDFSEKTFISVADFSELQIQVAIVNGMVPYEYTSASWAPVQKALDTGTEILEQGVAGQQDIDKAVAAIEKSLAGLVEMDYSRLETVLGEAYHKIDENPQDFELWVDLGAILSKARPLLVSGDQEAVDNAATELSQHLETMGTNNRLASEPEVVIQEVEVEVLPSSDYCNIPMHLTWPVLFAVSVVINLVLIFMLSYVIVRKRNTDDTTPLVSYDIDDDMDF